MITQRARLRSLRIVGPPQHTIPDNKVRMGTAGESPIRDPHAARRAPQGTLVQLGLHGPCRGWRPGTTVLWKMFNGLVDLLPLVPLCAIPPPEPLLRYIPLLPSGPRPASLPKTAAAAAQKRCERLFCVRYAVYPT